jgi:hypothetical protein
MRLVLPTLCRLAAIASGATDQPNVGFLLADDLGGAALRCEGRPYARTPNIDSLARDGTRFSPHRKGRSQFFSR